MLGGNGRHISSFLIFMAAALWWAAPLITAIYLASSLSLPVSIFSSKSCLSWRGREFAARMTPPQSKRWRNSWKSCTEKRWKVFSCRPSVKRWDLISQGVSFFPEIKVLPLFSLSFSLSFHDVQPCVRARPLRVSPEKSPLTPWTSPFKGQSLRQRGVMTNWTSLETPRVRWGRIEDQRTNCKKKRHWLDWSFAKRKLFVYLGLSEKLGWHLLITLLH